ncbi:protein UNUSUAL FLORAL ORGANS [Apium graveolens]|uniref:protein UNUSUAL FLORAL ORGANS n=1 Tax=Apium graveolens TaxID=4045 RepID=UPI003D7A646F
MEAFNTHINLPCIPYAFTTISSASCAFPGSITGTVTPWMDTRIWSRLPHRLIDRIIAFLPPAAFFRSRSVCKRWYALIFSTQFLEMYLQVSPIRHCFIFFKLKSLKSHIYKNNNAPYNIDQNRINCEGYMFDPQTITWHCLTFPLIPPGYSPSSSSGGLICWVSDEAGPKTIFLSNPLFGSLTPLPSTLRPRLFPSVGLTVSNSSIDIVLAGDDMISPYAVKNLTTESFHIDSSGFYSIWGTTSSLPRLCSLESGQMINLHTKFYCMNYSPFSVLTYDISSNLWCKIQAPMKRYLRSPNLVVINNKLVLVAAVEKSKLNVPKSLRLWALQSCGAAWAEIDRMPLQLYAQFEAEENGRGFNCVGNGEYVAVVIRGSGKAVLFDMGMKRWQWIPACPYENGGGELHGFAYDPKLATPVTGLLDQLTVPF